MKIFQLLSALVVVFAYVFVVSDAAKAKKGKSRKEVVSFFAGSSTQKLWWEQSGVNNVVTTFDVASPFSEAVVFTSYSSNVNLKKLNAGLDAKMDAVTLDKITFENMTGKVMAKQFKNNNIKLQLAYDDITSKTKNLTASTVNYGNYKVRYIGYSRDHPSEAAMLEKYEDLIPHKDLDILAPLSYMNFLKNYLKEDPDIVKALLGKDYAKPEKEENTNSATI